MKWLDAQLAAIRERLAKTRALNRKMVDHDIAAMRAEAQDARAILDLFVALQERAKKSGQAPTIHELCKALGDGWSYPQLRRRVQLLTDLDKYVERRRAAGDSGRYGLTYALELITDPVSVAAPAALPAPTNSHRREIVAPRVAPVPALTRKRYWRTSPERWQELRAEWPKIRDLFSYPPGEDAFALKRWPPSVYMNASFRREDNPFGRSLMESVAEAIRRNREEGCEVVIPVPTNDWTNALIEAGAEGRSWGREHWMDVDSDERWASPGASTLFILRGR